MQIYTFTLVFPFLLVGLLPWRLARLHPLAQNDTSQTEHAISREVDLVVLPVTVTDRHGHDISGLMEQNFRVYDNGQEQNMTQFSHDDLPVTVGLVVDDSGSMLPNRSEVITASKDFLRSSNPGDQVFVVNFNEDAALGLPAGLPFTSDVGQLEDAVAHGPTSGRTALYDAVYLGLVHEALGTLDKKALVVISDGGDNSSRHDFHQIQSLALHDNVLIYTIGIISDTESDVDPKLLRKLAEDTGGKSYFPHNAADVPGICQDIARDLREQYTLAYAPAGGLHGVEYHTIRVEVEAPGRGKLLARTRAGYYAPSQEGKTQK